MQRVLVVCLGNICRSPIAEAVLRARAVAAGVDIEVDSAGTGFWHIGNPPDARAQRAAASRGYDLSEQRARQVVPADFNRFDLILAVDRPNRAALEKLRPAGNTTPLHLVCDYGGGGADVPDPYYDERFDLVIDLIEGAADGILASLTADRV